MKKRHIIQISSYYPPHLGGQEYAVQNLATRLATQGHRVHVLTSSLGSQRHGRRREDRTLVERLGAFVFGHAPIMPGFPLALWRALRPDSVVHLHIGQAFTPEMVWLVTKLRRHPYIAQLHIDFEPSGPAGILLPLYKRFILKLVLRSAARVITLNQTTRDRVRENYGYRGTIAVLNNGIDEVYFKLRRAPFRQSPPQTLQLLFVGRFTKQKNVLSLLKALQHTKRPVQLHLVGDGEERSRIEQVIATSGLANVKLYGRLPRADVLEFYKSCDALIMPSLYEAQPLVLLEAMAARLPIIATNVIGLKEHIQDAGIVVAPTVSGLCEGIEQYFERYAELPAMVRRGQKRAALLGWPKTLKQYEALYETVLAH